MSILEIKEQAKYNLNTYGVKATKERVKIQNYDRY